MYESFATDFTLMKKTLLQLSHKVGEQADRISGLEIDIEQVKNENLKLTTDIKIIRNEHQEVLNSMFSLERRNSNFTAENEALKRMILEQPQKQTTYTHGSYDDRKKGSPLRRSQS